MVKVVPGYARNFLLPRSCGAGQRFQPEDRGAGAPGALRKEPLVGEAGTWENCRWCDGDHHAEGRRKRPVVRVRDGRDISNALVAKNYTIDRRKIQLTIPSSSSASTKYRCACIRMSPSSDRGSRQGRVANTLICVHRLIGGQKCFGRRV
jgi:hypothetical protein